MEHDIEKSLTEEAFEEAFWRLYAQKPVGKISVAELSALAGYNRGTFYLHWENLDALLTQLKDSLLGEIRVCVAGCMKRLEAGEDSEAVMQDVLDFYTAHKTQLSLLLGSNGDPQFVDALKEEMKPLWARYVLHKDEPMSDLAALSLEFTLSGVMFMLRKWIDNPEGVSAEELLHLIYHRSIKS